MIGPGSDKKRNNLLFFVVQKRTRTYCKRVKAGQGKGEEHWRRAVMSWQWSMQGAPYYHLLWNISWWDKLFAKIVVLWFIPKNVDKKTKSKKEFLCPFYVAKRTLHAFTICKKDFTGIHKFVTIFWTSPIWWNVKKNPAILMPAGFPKTTQKIFYYRTHVSLFSCLVQIWFCSVVETWPMWPQGIGRCQFRTLVDFKAGQDFENVGIFDSCRTLSNALTAFTNSWKLWQLLRALAASFRCQKWRLQ